MNAFEGPQFQNVTSSELLKSPSPQEGTTVEAKSPRTPVETEPLREPARKKTVVEMLLSESVCLANFDSAALRKLIALSKILEDDRRVYLLQELNQAIIGMIEMKSAETLLRDPKTLIFFLAAFEYQQEQGTIMVVIQSALHVIYVVFLRRQIIKTRRDEHGVFSFQFGPSKKSPPPPIKATPPLPSEPTTLPLFKPVGKVELGESSTLPGKRQARDEGRVEGVGVGMGMGMEGYLQSAKRTRGELLSGEPTSKVRPTGHASSLHLGASVTGANKDEAAERQALLTKQLALEAQVKALQLALFTSTRSIVAGSEASRMALEAKYKNQLQRVKEENASLRRAIELLLKQNQTLTFKISGGSGEANVEVLIPAPPPPSQHRLQGAGAATEGSSNHTIRLDSRWKCRWSRCDEAPYPNRDLLWRHVVEDHVRSQYSLDSTSVVMDADCIS